MTKRIWNSRMWEEFGIYILLLTTRMCLHQTARNLSSQTIICNKRCNGSFYKRPKDPL